MVNTFIPFSNFDHCAAVLDNRRLGKQRVEAAQILACLASSSPTRGWRNHPAVLMWTGYSAALSAYYNAVVREWIRRGFKNNMPLADVPPEVEMPWFVDCLTVQMSHRANLVRKDPLFYVPKFGVLPPHYTAYSYVWPSQLAPEQIAELRAKKDAALDIRLYAVRFADTSSGRKVQEAAARNLSAAPNTANNSG